MQHNSLFLCTLFFSALAGCGGTEQGAANSPQQTSSDELTARAEIAAQAVEFFKAFDQAWNDQDLDALLALTSDDVTMNRRGLTQGQERVGWILEGALKSGSSKTTVMQVFQVFRLEDNLCLVDVDQAITNDKGEVGKVHLVVTAIFGVTDPTITHIRVIPDGQTMPPW